MALAPAIFSSTIVAFLVVEWLTLLSPYNFLYGIGNQIPIYYAAYISAILSLIVFRQKIRSPMMAITWIILLLLLDGLMSTLAAPPINEDISTNTLIVLIKISINVFCLVSVLTSRSRLHALVVTFILGLGFYAVTDGLKYIASGGAHVIYGVPQLGDNNSYGMVMLMLAPIAYYMSRCLDLWWVRIGVAGLSALSVVTAIGTLSRGTFIALIAMSILFVVRSKKRFRSLVIVLIASALIATVATQRWSNRIDTIETADEDNSFMGRVAAWKLSWVVAIDRPFTGLGFAGLGNPVLWQSYVPEFNRQFPGERIDKVNGHAAHSIVFQTLSDLGFPGLFIFLALIGTSFLNIFYIRRRTRTFPEMQWMDDLASGFELSLVAYVVAGLALSVAYFEPFFILITMIAALRRLASEAIIERAQGTHAVPSAVAAAGRLGEASRWRGESPRSAV